MQYLYLLEHFKSQDETQKLKLYRVPKHKELVLLIVTNSQSCWQWCSISHVKVVGRPALPTFDVEMLDQSGTCVLRYCSCRESAVQSPSLKVGGPSRLSTFNAIWNRILGAGAGTVASDDDETEDELPI